MAISFKDITSEQKRFLESIGITEDNQPSLDSSFYETIQEFTWEERDALFDNKNPNVRVANSKFSMKDVVGTNNYNYAGKEWIEAFLASKRGDAVIQEYFNNPDYWEKDLKELDQSDLTHDTPIELAEKDGKYYILGGNNRIIMMKIKYLAEIEQARGNQEKIEEIDDRYTFVGEVRSIEKEQNKEKVIEERQEETVKPEEIQEISRSEVEEIKVDYVQRYSPNWDEVFNDIVADKANKLDKGTIKAEMLSMADGLNNEWYMLQNEGKITAEQKDQIVQKFNEAFNKALVDFDLGGLSPTEMARTSFSVNDTYERLKNGETIEQIRASYINDEVIKRDMYTPRSEEGKEVSQENIRQDNIEQDSHIIVPEGRFDDRDMFLDSIVREGQDISLTDEEIKNSAREISVLDREFTQGKDEVSRDD